MASTRRLAGVALALTAACGGGSPAAPTPTAPIVKVTLLPNVLQIGSLPFPIGVGDSTQLSASAWTNEFTFTDVTPAAQWQTSPPGLVAVSSNGLATGRAPGLATVTATYQSQTGSGQMRVFGDQEVADLQVTIRQTTPLIPGQGTDAFGTARLLDGTTVNVGQWFGAWTSSNTAVATVSPFGAVSATGAGTAQISDAYHGRSGSVQVTVTPVAPGEDAVQELGEGFSPVTRLLRVDVTYNVVSGPAAVISLQLTDRTGANLGSSPPVSVTASRGAGAASLSDTFIAPVPGTAGCHEVVLTITGGARVSTGRLCSIAF